MTLAGIVNVSLILVWARGDARAQATVAAGGEEWPARIAVRNNQGKTVYVPAPNPAQRVDYIQWLDETLGGGIENNAASAYGEAYKLYRDADIREDVLEQALAGPWAGLEGVNAWLTTNRASMERFRQAAMKRQCYFALARAVTQEKNHEAPAQSRETPAASGPYAGFMLPDLLPHRSICKALVADGWAAFKQGNENRIVENSLVLLRSARHLEHQATVIHHLAGRWCATMAYDALRTALSRSAHADATAARLAVQLSAADPVLDLRQVRILALDPVLTFRDACQRAFAPGAEPGTWQVRKDAFNWPSDWDDLADQEEFAKIKKQLAEAAAQLPEFGYEATLREGDQLARRFGEWLAKPYHESPREGEEIRAAIEGSRNPLVRSILPDLSRVRVLDEQRIASRRATHLIVQLLLHRTRSRSFPARLDELKAASLGEIRIDPFSGQDFVYKRQSGSFLLYSVGEDLQDGAGGTMHPGKPAISCSGRCRPVPRRDRSPRNPHVRGLSDHNGRHRGRPLQNTGAPDSGRCWRPDR